MIFWIERNDNARHYMLMPDAGLAQAVSVLSSRTCNIIDIDVVPALELNYSSYNNRNGIQSAIRLLEHSVLVQDGCYRKNDGINVNNLSGEGMYLVRREFVFMSVDKTNDFEVLIELFDLVSAESREDVISWAAEEARVLVEMNYFGAEVDEAGVTKYLGVGLIDKIKDCDKEEVLAAVEVIDQENLKILSQSMSDDDRFERIASLRLANKREKMLMSSTTI